MHGQVVGGVVLETMTLGYRPVKIDTMQAAMVTVVAAKQCACRCVTSLRWHSGIFCLRPVGKLALTLWLVPRGDDDD